MGKANFLSSGIFKLSEDEANSQTEGGIQWIPKKKKNIESQKSKKALGIRKKKIMWMCQHIKAGGQGQNSKNQGMQKVHSVLLMPVVYSLVS